MERHKGIAIVNDITKHYIADSPASLSVKSKVLGYLRARNYPELAECTRHFDSALHSVEELRFLRQIAGFYKKNQLFVRPTECSHAALVTFDEGERQCSDTNIRLRKCVGFPGNVPAEFQTRILKMRRWISNVLGDFDSFLEALPRLVKVTSGATSTSKRIESIPQLKLRMRLYCTTRAAKYLYALYRTYGFEAPRFRYTPTNRVELVRKNWKTDRTIACEPEGNLPLQLAFDRYAKRCLKRYGINLSDQFKNQRLARLSSIDGSLATVDFKNASGTVAFNTVSLLFPTDWFSYLRDVRTPAYRWRNGSEHGTYSMFSSMGNGSTFCIETLIFSAAAAALGSRRFSVYGDDVIIETELFDEYVKLMQFLGLTINPDKSFSSGSFRESCGKDWYNGCDVTPVYIKSVDSRKALLCHLVNSVLQICVPYGALARYMLKLLNEYKLPLVPVSENSVAGVWIEPSYARKLKVLRTSFRSKLYILGEEKGQVVWFPYVDNYMSYVPSTSKRNFYDIRGYYLWFLDKLNSVVYGTPFFDGGDVPIVEDVRTSSATLFLHKYVRKRVFWREPKVIPDHLSWWSKYFLVSNRD